MTERKVLDGNIAEDARAQLEALIKSGVTPYRIYNDTGVNSNTLKRFREGENITVEQLDKIGSWIVSQNM